nr:hypothetical protein [Candidatus Cloacimonadota bacterium]
MKKLIHLQLLPILSGVQRFSLYLLEGLPRDQYEIYLAGAPGGELEREVRNRGWTFLPLKCLKHPISLMDIPALIQICWLFTKHRFDIVHTNSSKPGLLGRLAARLTSVPLIVHTVHGAPFQDHQSRLSQVFFKHMEKLGNALGNYTIFVNHSDRERYLKLHLVQPNKALTIYNAMPDKQILLPTVPKTKDDRCITIGSTIRFSEQKNVISMLIAACQACHQESKLKFIILGDGEHLELCRSIVASHHLSERILLPGWDSQVQPWLAIFDAFVLYSRWESMPFSIIEAMQAGLPVIGSNIPSIMELVNEDCGWIVPLYDQKALIETYIRVARDPHGIRTKGENARSRIQRFCDYDAMVSAYRRIYEGGS